jgi:hypothetical protein
MIIFKAKLSGSRADGNVYSAECPQASVNGRSVSIDDQWHIGEQGAVTPLSGMPATGVNKMRREAFTLKQPYGSRQRRVAENRKGSTGLRLRGEQPEIETLVAEPLTALP